MSKQTLEWIVGKIALDDSFREDLLAAPDPTLAEYDLLESEMIWLKAIDLETMEAIANILALRLGKHNPNYWGSNSNKNPNGGKNVA